jgi:hypothetical protein
MSPEQKLQKLCQMNFEHKKLKKLCQMSLDPKTQKT